MFSLARKTFPAAVHAWTLPAAEASPSSHLGSRWLQGHQPSPGFQHAGPLPEPQEVTSSRWAQPWSKTPGTLNLGELDQRETPASARRGAGAHSPPCAHSRFPAQGLHGLLCLWLSHTPPLTPSWDDFPRKRTVSRLTSQDLLSRSLR